MSDSMSVQATTQSRLTVRLLPFLFLLYMVAYIDRINVGFAALQMQGQLGLNDEVYGLGAGIFFFGYLLFQIPSNRVLERVGARRWMAFLLLAWGIVSASMLFIRGEKSFYALRFLLGATEAGFFPGMIFYLKNWFPAPSRARAVALFMTASPMSGVIGGPISGALLNLHNIAGLSGWQWMFLLEGIPAILLSIVVLALLPDTPERAHWLTAEQKAWLEQTLADERRAAVSQSTNPWAVFKLGSVWLLALMYFGMNTTVYGVGFWLPKLVRSQSGMSTFHIGLLTAVPYVFTAISMVLVGLHSDRTGERRIHVFLCAMAGVVALLVAAFSSSFIPMFIGVGFAALATNSMYGPYWAMPTRMFPPALAATGIALINSLGNTGGAFGPYMIGLLRNSSGAFRGGLLVLAAWLTIAAFTTFAIPYSTKSPRDASAGSR